MWAASQVGGSKPLIFFAFTQAERKDVGLDPAWWDLSDMDRLLIMVPFHLLLRPDVQNSLDFRRIIKSNLLYMIPSLGF